MNSAGSAIGPDGTDMSLERYDDAAMGAVCIRSANRRYPIKPGLAR